MGDAYDHVSRKALAQRLAVLNGYNAELQGRCLKKLPSSTDRTGIRRPSGEGDAGRKVRHPSLKGLILSILCKTGLGKNRFNHYREMLFGMNKILDWKA